jgi:hypothetical protein
MAEKKKFLLRIDPDLFDALERWAADDFRSVNAQVEYLLRDLARRSKRLKPNKETAVDSSNLPAPSPDDPIA